MGCLSGLTFLRFLIHFLNRFKQRLTFLRHFPHKVCKISRLVRAVRHRRLLLNRRQQGGFDTFGGDPVVFQLGIRDQRVSFTGRFLRDQTGTQTLTEADDQVVDVGTRGGVLDVMFVGFPQFVRAVIHVGVFRPPRNDKRFGGVPPIRFFDLDRNFVFSDQRFLEQGLGFLHPEVDGGGQHVFTAATSADVGGGFTTEISGDGTFQPFLAFDAVQQDVGFVTGVGLQLLKFATTNDTDLTGAAVSNLNDLRDFAGA